MGVVPGWVTPWEVSHQVARNKFVRYTLVKSRGKSDNIVVEVGGMLQSCCFMAVRKHTLSNCLMIYPYMVNNSSQLSFTATAAHVLLEVGICLITARGRRLTGTGTGLGPVRLSRQNPGYGPLVKARS